MIAKGKPRFDQLDLYLLQKDYESAMAAINDELGRRPDNVNLQLRQAEICALLGERDQALDLYTRLARRFAEDGFYARAIAVANKVQRLDPGQRELNRELAEFIAGRQDAEKTARDRMTFARPSPAGNPTPAHSGTEPAAPAPAPPAAESAAAPSPAPPVAPQPVAPLQDPPGSGPTAEEALQDRHRAASRFFAAFPAPALEQLLSSTSVRSYAPAQVVFREGDPGNSMFLIEDGTVQVLTRDPAGEPLQLARLGAGEFFGEVAVHTGRPRTATVVAVTTVSLIEITREDLSRIAVAHPEVTDVVRRFCEQRAEATVEAMLQRLRNRDA